MCWRGDNFHGSRSELGGGGGVGGGGGGGGGRGEGGRGGSLDDEDSGVSVYVVLWKHVNYHQEELFIRRKLS